MKIFYLMVSLMGVAYCKKLPSFIEVCSKSDPKIVECLKRNIEKLRPMFLKGIPELQIPSMNPLQIPKASLANGNAITADFTNLQIYQLNDFTIDKLDVDLDHFKLDVTLTFPRLRIMADYHIKGKILVMDLDGSGPADGNYTNVRIHFKSEGSRNNRNGKNYIKIDKTSIDMEIGEAHVFFDRIFGDNEELNANTNKIINDNIETLITDLKPVISEIVDTFLVGITKRLFDKYPIEDLFKP
ncbi:protein takeout-like [Leptinotarsa decemlineata]|uniref:protein takeout-like n=1 Tax=Leptinotarsa decemlineata TaxID=7539 RepID=UPI003D305F02